ACSPVLPPSRVRLALGQSRGDPPRLVKGLFKSCRVLFVGTEPGDGLLRIGELSRRVGVSDHVLRAWERRYGLLKPVRSAGGFRLYSEADEGRVRRMQAHLAGGLSAAEAARAALGEDGAAAAGGSASVAVERHEGLADRAGALALALDELDEPAAQAVFDRLLSDFTVE